MLICQNKDHMNKVVKFAKKTGKIKSLVENLKFLNEYAGKQNTRCLIRKDWGTEPNFVFEMQRKDQEGNYRFMFNGGLLFHGPHDGFGSGLGPTFAVTLNPTDGFSIHT